MKKFVSIILVIVLVFLAAITVFLFIQNNNLKKEIEVLNKKIEDLQKPTLTPITETHPEGWKEYIDSGYKFKLWYPERFSYENVTDQTKIQKNKNKENTVAFYVNVLTDAPLGLLSINIYNDNLTIKEFIKTDAENIIKYFPNTLDKNVSNYIRAININGMDFYKFEIPNEFIIKYYIKKDDNIFVLKPENEDLGLYPGLEQVVNQMIQSFRFIE